MLHLLRIGVLVLVGALLVEAAIQIRQGSTGVLENAVVAGIACLWILAVVREVRGLAGSSDGALDRRF